MPTYAIGDIQGCFSALMQLLQQFSFDVAQDTLWFTGDLVNRGPASLEVLRFVKALGQQHVVVLGNHDLHLLAVHFKANTEKKYDTLREILLAPDRDALMAWLRGQPLIHHDAALGYTMVHAGLAPSWDIQTAIQLAHEVESVLQSDHPEAFLQVMYGDDAAWHDDLQGWPRLRVITNYLTRARFCFADGSLELIEKERSEHPTLTPWFRYPARKTIQDKIIFGHWAALQGVTNTANVFALDTGCVWGGALTAMCLEDGKRYAVNSPNLVSQSK